MSGTKQYLNYEGLGLYHQSLVERLKDLEYDPSRMFADKVALVTYSNWEHDQYGRIFGLKEGLIVTVGKQIWQLEDPDTFGSVLRTIGLTPEEKAARTEEQLGWKIVGSTVDFNIDGHTLQLIK